MATPSSQVAASWVKEELQGTEWTPLRDALLEAMQKRWKNHSDDEYWDFVDANLAYVAEHLREELATCKLDGAVPTYEIDDEQLPYVRASSETAADILEKMRRIDPFKFEELCAKILTELGATAHTTQKSYDGGVDFIGINLNIVPSALVVPVHSQAAVIGQAKRYKDGNLIKETHLREFVGAAALRRHQLQRDEKLGPLTPVILAFWTTADFEPNARTFGRSVGIWYMGGNTLAAYVNRLGLRDYVMALPDHDAGKKAAEAQPQVAPAAQPPAEPQPAEQAEIEDALALGAIAAAG